MKTKMVRIFLVVSLLTMGLLLAAPTPTFACYGRITIVKETDPDGGTGFNFSGDLGSSFTLNDDGSKSFDKSGGWYNVTESVPSGWDLDSVVCAGGDSENITNGVRIHLEYDRQHITCTFTNKEQGGPQRCIKARKFNDKDGDGYKDRGEDGLSGWVFTLSRKENDAWVQCGDPQTTDSNGYAYFGEWPVGDEYKIVETRQDGWTCTNCTSAEAPFTLSEGGYGCKEVKFGNRPSPFPTCCEGATSITLKNISSGYVNLWFYEGTQANHKPTPFATFANVAPGQVVTLNASVYFPSSGYFPEHIYNHGEGCHWGWDIQLICDDPASLAVGDRNPDYGWGQKLEVVEVVWEGDCGSLGNYVWHDVNINGLQDDGASAGIANVTVNLYDDTDTLIHTTQTDSDGYYIFNNLEAGDYYVEFMPPLHYDFSRQDQGNDDALDSDADPTTGKTGIINLSAGETDLTWDAGLHLCIIGDRVWHDEDGKKDQDGTEPGLNGVEVYLYPITATSVTSTTCGTILGPLAMTTTISGTSQTPDGLPDGIYYFDMGELGVLGQYLVCVKESTLQPAGTWILTTGSNPQTVTYTGKDNFSFDFGYVYGGNPTAVTLSSFAAKSSAGGSASGLWLGLAGLTLATSSLFWAKRRAG